jgi:dipeptidyl aminopeptidase/acylaminoacyl peptidase
MTLGHTEPSGQVYRLVALDLTGANRHVELATWQMPARMPTMWGEAFSASSDGRRIALSGTGARGTGALYLLDTAAGTVKTLFDDATEHATAAALSPDGTQIAFVRMPVLQNASSVTETGIFAGAVDDPASWRRIVNPEPPNSMAPLAWSPDGRWLAFVRLFVGGNVWLVRSDGSDTMLVGRGTDADWRSWEPRLLISGPSNGGGETGVATFDVTSRVLRKIAVPSADLQSVMGARWHPALDRILYIEVVAQAPGPQVAVWTRYADGRNASKVNDASFVSRVDWSADGSRIYAAIGGDDSVLYISDLLSGQGATKACRRGDVNAQVCL